MPDVQCVRKYENLQDQKRILRMHLHISGNIFFMTVQQASSYLTNMQIICIDCYTYTKNENKFLRAFCISLLKVHQREILVLEFLFHHSLSGWTTY
jgi:hypothetical protein